MAQLIQFNEKKQKVESDRIEELLSIIDGYREEIVDGRVKDIAIAVTHVNENVRSSFLCNDRSRTIGELYLLIAELAQMEVERRYEEE